VNRGNACRGQKFDVDGKNLPGTSPACYRGAGSDVNGKQWLEQNLEKL